MLINCQLLRLVGCIVCRQEGCMISHNLNLPRVYTLFICIPVSVLLLSHSIFSISSLSRCPGSGARGIVNLVPRIFIIDVVFLCYCGLSTNRAGVDLQSCFYTCVIGHKYIFIAKSVRNPLEGFLLFLFLMKSDIFL